LAKNVFAGVGISKKDDPFEAGKEAVYNAIEDMKKLGGNKPTFGIVFCSGGKYGKNDKKMQKLVDGANSILKDTPWVGCTTAGEISNFGFTTESCVALVLESEYINFGIGVGENTNEKPKEAGRRAIKDALKKLKVDKYVEPYVRYLAEKKLPVSELIKMRPYHVLMLTTGFTLKKRGNEDDIVEGIIDVIGHRVPIIGGSSADDFNLKETYVFSNGKVYTNSVVCTVISSSIKFGEHVSHGYIPTEKSMFVRKTENYTVYELDDKPAFDRYSEILNKEKRGIWPKSMQLQKLGPISTTFMSFAKKMGVDAMKLSPIIEINCKTPLALCEYKPYVKGRFWIKTIDSVVKNKYLRFTEKVPQGTTLYLMKTDSEKTLKASQNSVKESLKEINGNASFAIIFDCALHRWFLGEHAKKSVELMGETLKNIPFIGFHAYGEILDGKHSVSVVSMMAGDELVVKDADKT